MTNSAMAKRMLDAVSGIYSNVGVLRTKFGLDDADAPDTPNLKGVVSSMVRTMFVLEHVNDSLGKITEAMDAEDSHVFGEPDVGEGAETEPVKGEEVDEGTGTDVPDDTVTEDEAETDDDDRVDCELEADAEIAEGAEPEEPVEDDPAESPEPEPETAPKKKSPLEAFGKNGKDKK